MQQFNVGYVGLVILGVAMVFRLVFGTEDRNTERSRSRE
jgi:hypothetical protein